ncbi:unnamed protein product [Eretmochelys imbricata]
MKGEKWRDTGKQEPERPFSIHSRQLAAGAVVGALQHLLLLPTTVWQHRKQLGKGGALDCLPLLYQQKRNSQTKTPWSNFMYHSLRHNMRGLYISKTKLCLY